MGRKVLFYILTILAVSLSYSIAQAETSDAEMTLHNKRLERYNACMKTCDEKDGRGEFRSGPYQCYTSCRQSWSSDFEATQKDTLQVEKVDDKVFSVKISGLSRKVEIQQQGGEWIPATDLLTLKVGDKIHTGFKAGATLTFLDGSTLVLKPMTMVILQEIDGRKRVWVREGEVSAKVERPTGSPADLEVRTTTVTASVRGTVFNVRYDGSTTTVSVIEGVVNVAPVNNALAAFDLTAGNEASVSEKIATSPSPLTKEKERYNFVLATIITLALGAGYFLIRRIISKKQGV